MMSTADGDRATRIAPTPHHRSEHPQSSPCHGLIGSRDTRASWRLYRLCAAFGRETRRASEPRERARTIGARSEHLARDTQSMNPPLVMRSAVKSSALAINHLPRQAELSRASRATTSAVQPSIVGAKSSTRTVSTVHEQPAHSRHVPSSAQRFSLRHLSTRPVSDFF